jgi:hypothetical protein
MSYAKRVKLLKVEILCAQYLRLQQFRFRTVFQSERAHAGVRKKALDTSVCGRRQ